MSLKNSNDTIGIFFLKTHLYWSYFLYIGCVIARSKENDY